MQAYQSDAQKGFNTIVCQALQACLIYVRAWDCAGSGTGRMYNELVQCLSMLRCRAQSSLVNFHFLPITDLQQCSNQRQCTYIYLNAQKLKFCAGIEPIEWKAASDHLLALVSTYIFDMPNKQVEVDFTILCKLNLLNRKPLSNFLINYCLKSYLRT